MSIWTNWDPLEEVIVGDSYSPGDLDWALDPSIKEQFNQLLKETKEDLDNLALLLSNLGVIVHRPVVTKYNGSVDLKTFLVKNPAAPVVPRDQYLAYGNTIYQTYTSMPDRYIDSVNYYAIFKNLYDQGYNWISQPPPPLTDLAGIDHWWSENQPYTVKLKDQILWHTATMFKCGDALIVNSQGPGSQLGLDWMKRNMPDTRIVERNEWGHIDHGFFMTDDSTVWCVDKSWVPECLHDKKIMEIGHLVELFDFPKYGETFSQYERFSKEWIQAWFTEWKGYDQAVSFDTNVLVVDPNNVIFSNHQPKLFEAMESQGITCHVANQRHGIFWESGIHCLTLDIKRKGNRRKII